MLCVYDESGATQPLLRATVPAGGTCAGKPCWKAISRGFKYRDKDRTPDGIALEILRSGPSISAKVIVKGKGDNLSTPVLPLTPTVTVQLKNDDGECWEGEYSTPLKNQADQFKSHAD